MKTVNVLLIFLAFFMLQLLPVNASNLTSNHQTQQNYKSEVIEDNGYALNNSEALGMNQRIQFAIDENGMPRRKKKKSELLASNLEIIQDRYRNSITPYSNIALPADQDEAIDRVKGYSRDFSVRSEEQEISTKSMRKICKDMGFSEEDQRLSLEFNNCITEAMKTKLTEETIAKRPYTTIDIKIVQILQSDTKTDSSIKNLSYYEELLNQRNRLDCLKQKDYVKCVNSIVTFKECTNKATNVTLFEHNRNKVICYVKTGVKFPHPTVHEERVRDAYFGVCIHLIEKDLKQKILEMNSICNDILINGDISGLAI